MDTTATTAATWRLAVDAATGSGRAAIPAGKRTAEHAEHGTATAWAAPGDCSTGRDFTNTDPAVSAQLI